MRRILLLLLVTGLFEVWFQSIPSAYAQHDTQGWKGMPLGIIPVEALKGYDQYLAWNNRVDVLSTEAQLMRRMSRVYGYQVAILAALSNGNDEQAGVLLEQAVLALERLAARPQLRSQSRFRELYRSIVTEYERYYGSLNPDMELVFGLRDGILQPPAVVATATQEPALLMRTVGSPAEVVVPMTQNDHVRRTIDYFLKNKRENILSWMTRADTYFPMIEKIFAEEGVPDELKYLAVVESALVPNARSRSNAHGMWQFMNATGKVYGLDVTSWVDERWDPEKATRAAARHLKDLYDHYGGNWHVALAGYNCSPRCIRRAVQRAGGSMNNIPSYWSIYRHLPRETRGYMPQFIAIAILMSNPKDFGLAAAPEGPEFTFDRVAVEGMMTLKDIAELVGSDEATMEALNPELRRSILPPGTAPYQLRIPLNTAARFVEAVESLPQGDRPPAVEYTVRRGDSLGRIANNHGVTVSDLRSANGLRGNLIHPGQKLIIPVPNSQGRISLAEGSPSTVRYGRRVLNPVAFSPELARPADVLTTPAIQANLTVSPLLATAAQATQRGADNRTVHVVRRGDTLGKLAGLYGTTIRSIQQWNNLRGSTRIRVGQKLTMYPKEQSRVVHVVRRGESLSRIASKYGTSVRSIRQLNSLRSSTIHPGQRLQISP